jgi:prolyl 4-hydroxylase
MIILHKQSLRGNNGLKQRIWDGVKPIISEWVGHELKDTSLYGIRVYSDGAILATRKCTVE